MRLVYGHKLLEMLQKHLETNFDGDSWGANGPDAITKVIYSLCNTTKALDDVTSVTKTDCFNLTAFPPETFYPGGYSTFHTVFEEENMEEVLIKAKNSFTLHLWNQWSHGNILTSEGDTALKAIALENCPVTATMFQSHPEHF